MAVRKSRSPEALKERIFYRKGYYLKDSKKNPRRTFTINWVYEHLKRLKIPSMFCKVEFLEDDNIKILVPKKFRSRVKKTINEVWYVEQELVKDAIILTEIDEWKSLK